MPGVTEAKPKKKGRPRVAEKKKPVISLRGSEEWANWVKDLCDYTRMRPNDLIDQLLVKHATELGFDKKAPKRRVG